MLYKRFERRGSHSTAARDNLSEVSPDDAVLRVRQEHPDMATTHKTAIVVSVMLKGGSQALNGAD